MKPCVIILIILIGIKCQFFQLVKQYSINLRDSHNTASSLSAYRLEGDVMVTSKRFQLTKNETGSFGRIITKDDLNSTDFEYQLIIKQNNGPSDGSLFGIWFYNNITKDNDNTRNENQKTSNSFFGFSNDFNGFGIIGVASPTKDPDSMKTRLSFISSKNAKQYSISEKPSDSCNIISKAEKLKLIIKYSHQSMTLVYNNKRNLNSHCFGSFTPEFNANQFKIAITTFNGIIDNVQYRDTIEVFKISLINKDKSRAAAIAKYIPSQIIDNKANDTRYNYIRSAAADLVDKYYESNNQSQSLQLQSSSLLFDDLDKKIDAAIEYLSKIKNGNGYEVNLTEIYSSLSQLSTHLVNLTLLLNDTNINTSSNSNMREKRVVTRSDRIQLLSLELNLLLSKWSRFQTELNGSNTTNEDIKTNIIELTNNIKLAQNMQEFIAETLKRKVSLLNKDIDKKIESNTLYHYFLIGLICIGIVLLVWIYQKLKLKQKRS